MYIEAAEMAPETAGRILHPHARGEEADRGVDNQPGPQRVLGAKRRTLFRMITHCYYFSLNNRMIYEILSSIVRGYSRARFLTVRDFCGSR